jgi:predicted alpha/beta superfamily hydrolase
VDSNEFRSDEYLPKRWQGMGGKAELYNKMLKYELVPLLRRKYRIESGPQSMGICGSSFGAVLAQYCCLRADSLFTRAALCSPSIWWGPDFMLGEVSALPSKLHLKVWIDAGDLEGTMAHDARDLVSAYRVKGWVVGRDLAFYDDPIGEHTEGSWARRFPMVLEFLYGVGPSTQGR